jgi:dolichol-phosphate mannosyltransferase
MRPLVCVLTYNEGPKLRALLDRFPDDADYDLLFVDDGSTDGSAELPAERGHALIRHGTNRGVGAGIRSSVSFARQHDYDVLVIMAGNGKMLPEEIPRLLEPIRQGRADYVQGSRYLKGGQSPNLPLFRRIMIRWFTKFVSLTMRTKASDITCGFRAYRLTILDYPDIDIDQEWLERYEMEYYLHYKVLKHGVPMVEVPVSMVYPESRRDYSKIRPLTGWWSMVRPWIFLILGLRK